MDTRKRLVALLIVPLFAGCISAKKTSGGTWSGQRDSQSSSVIATRPAGEIQADTMDGLLNVLTKIDASLVKFSSYIGAVETNFAKLTTHVESRVGKLENAVAKVEAKVNAKLTIGGGSDSITSWINALVPWLSMSWLVYPLVWRPLRQRKERKRHGG